jgi:hypothetical protein
MVNRGASGGCQATAAPCGRATVDLECQRARQHEEELARDVMSVTDFGGPRWHALLDHAQAVGRDEVPAVAAIAPCIVRGGIDRDPPRQAAHDRRKRWLLAASAPRRIPSAFGPMPCSFARSASVHFVRSRIDRTPALCNARSAGPPTPFGNAASFGCVVSRDEVISFAGERVA